MEESFDSIHKAIKNSVGAPRMFYFIEADTLLMCFKFSEAIEKVDSIFSNLKKDEKFDFAGSCCMISAGCAFFLGDEAKAREHLKKIPKLANPKSRQDQHSIAFYKSYEKDESLINFVGYYHMYGTRSLEHMNAENATTLEKMLDETKSKMKTLTLEAEAFYLLFSGVLKKKKEV